MNMEELGWAAAIALVVMAAFALLVVVILKYPVMAVLAAVYLILVFVLYPLIGRIIE